jgi:hypothetical protein
MYKTKSLLFQYIYNIFPLLFFHSMFGSAPCAPFKDYLEIFRQIATEGWEKELLKLYSNVCFVIKILLFNYIYA